MADNGTVIIRIKISASDGNYGFLTYIMDMGSKNVTDSFAMGGSTDEYATMSVSEPYQKYFDWVQNNRFYTKYDPSTTQDLERFAKGSSKNMEFTDKLHTIIKSGAVQDLEYNLKNEMTVIMGDRDPRIEINIHQASEDDLGGAEEAQPQSEGSSAINPMSFLQLAFRMSPLEGVFLTDLQPGDKAFARIKDMKNPLSKSFIERTRVPNEDLPSEYPVTIKSMQANPAGGMFIFVTMSDGNTALVVEEETNIKVKVPRGKKAQRSRMPAGAPGGGGADEGILSNPKYLVIALVVMLTILGVMIAVLF